jgi:parallel beta-helix repeat protein
MFLLSLLLVPSQVVISQGSRTIYVDDDNVNGPWHGSIDFPYRLIQDGIDAAIDGDMVFVNDGFYVENIIIENASIRLMGENFSRTVVDGNGTGNVIEINRVEDVMISYLTIQNGKNGITTIGANNTFSNNVIQNNTGRGINANTVNSRNQTIFRNIFINNRIGLYLSFTNFNNIKENQFKNNEFGIWISQLSSHNQVSNNMITNNKCGISVSMLSPFSIKSENDQMLFSPDLSPEDNDIISNNIVDNEYGIYLWFGSTKIANNNIKRNSRYGVWYEGGLVDITGNNFIENMPDHAYFIRNFCSVLLRNWDQNYWDDWQKTLPRPIHGEGFFFWFEESTVLYVVD